jgi:hypothetical protein
VPILRLAGKAPTRRRPVNSHVRRHIRQPAQRSDLTRRARASLRYPLAMKVAEILRLLQQDGWYLAAQRGSHRQFKHASRPNPTLNRSANGRPPGPRRAVVHHLRLAARRPCRRRPVSSALGAGYANRDSGLATAVRVARLVARTPPACSPIAPLPHDHSRGHLRHTAKNCLRAQGSGRRLRGTHAGSRWRRHSGMLASRLRRWASPNPTLKRSANGMAPGPRAPVVHHAPRGPGTIPSSPV